MKALYLLACITLPLWFLPAAALDITLNNTPTQVCFTPGGNCTQLIVNAIKQAKTSVRMQAYSFTSKPIANALIQAHKNGIKVNVILDKSDTHSKYTQMGALSRAHIPIFIDSKVRIAHNKIIIVDSSTVVGGSFNFTYSAQHRNAENVLIITNKALAAAYLNNFNTRLKQSTPLMQYCFVTSGHHCRTAIVKTWDNVLPPAYLSVPHWKKCFSTGSKGTWTAYCLPNKRPHSCPSTSWDALIKQKALSKCHASN